ncbi:MAG: Omp28-related outer membrane protein [Flavobacteriales bacterium]
MRILSLVAVFVLFSIACKVDNTQKVFDSIEPQSENHSFVFMLGSNHNFISTSAQEKQFNALFSGAVSGIDASKVNGFVIFPEGDAGLSSSTAAAFKALYEGSNTIFYPEVYENMIRYDVQYTNWKKAIKNTLASSSICAIGTKTVFFGKNLNIYVKTQLNAAVDSTANVAVYAVNKSVVASQDTSLTESNPNYKHLNVLKSSIGVSEFGEPCESKASGAICKKTFVYSVGANENLSDLNFVVVVFEMHSGLPKKVLNCRTIKL